MTPEALQVALEAQERRHDRRLGTLLVEAGALSLDQLRAAIRDHIVHLLTSAFGWSEATFVFEPAIDLLGPPTELGMSLIQLLRTGIPNQSDGYLRARWLPERSEKLLLAVPEEADTAGLEPGELVLLHRCAEPTLVAEMIGPGTGVLRRIELLYALGLLDCETRPCRVPNEPEAIEVHLEDDDTTEEFDEPTIQIRAPGCTATVGTAPTPPTLALATSNPAPDDARAWVRLLDFLRGDLLAERRSAEHEIRALSEELGRLRERLRALEEENQKLRQVSPAAAPVLVPAARSRTRAPRKKPAAVA